MPSKRILINERRKIRSKLREILRQGEILFIYSCVEKIEFVSGQRKRIRGEFGSSSNAWLVIESTQYLKIDLESYLLVFKWKIIHKPLQRLVFSAVWIHIPCAQLWHPQQRDVLLRNRSPFLALDCNVSHMIQAWKLR